MMSKKALYLAGGGARGAYQAGVLKAVNHIIQSKTIPFHIVSGVSVGSINAAILAECADNFSEAVEKLEWVWADIRCDNVFEASNYALGKSVIRNLSTIFIKQQQAGHLLNTTPLLHFLQNTLNFKKISENVSHGHLTAFEVIANCYETHQTVSFYESNIAEFEDWNYPRHGSQRAKLTTEHILASSALPLFFPPVKLQGLHYGDGSIGLVAPLRGAIRFEVDSILILGTREAPTFTKPESLESGDVAFSNILGNMMNGLFLDNLDRDIEMVNRMNEIAILISLWKKRRSPWRPITTLHLRPSRNMAALAQEHFKNIPALLRFLLNTMGTKNHSGDLLSFLLFEKEFTRSLLTLGYNDTLACAKQISDFFS
jgi:NTE family protein